MKLTFLGTAAAEGIPAVFCNCPLCTHAKAVGGKDIRTRSQILIDNDVLFDFPMDTYMHMLRFKLDLAAVRLVLITHSHMDHCYPQEFCMRGEPFAKGVESTVSVVCGETVREIFATDTAREMRPEINKNIDLRVVRPFERVQFDSATVIPVPARHTAGEDCFCYYVNKNGKGALMLNDTGILDYDVYARLADMGAKVDVVTFDCTYGVKRKGAGRHMGLFDAADQAELIQKAGLFNPNAKKIVTHFSHNAALDHDGLDMAAREVGMIAAFDGLVITI